VLLSTVIRQGEDQTQFKNIVSSIREYKLSSDQAQWLQNYQWDDLKKQYGLNFTKSLDSHGLFVFPTHNEEWAHSKIKLLEANEHFPVAKIDAVCHGLHSKHLQMMQWGGTIFWKFTCWIYYVHDSSRRAIKEAKFYI
jgi:hypothetical protein